MFGRLPKKRRVRLHLDDPRPSVEGVLLGVAADHYRIAVPRVLETPSDAHDLASKELWVPATNVVLFEELS